ncbi:MAG: DUF58 domain-containing protein [Alphaproteobacteria bacterium]|nr:DUF58 domain-containing protein [Alphaproteobacteria bacterium]
MAEEYSPVSVDELSLRALRLQTHAVVIEDSKKQAYSNTGTSNSPFRTRGLDFQEIRAYQPGDDVRQIDWRTTAKHGKPFTKLYTDEKERPVYFICDMRSRMKFASHGDFKSVVAARMTTFLAWLVEKKKDRIGSVILMPDQLKCVDLKGNRGVNGLIADLVAAGTPDPGQPDQTTLEQAFMSLARGAKNGAMIFICSDFSDLTPESLQVLSRLSTRRTLALIHIYDEMEAQMPYGFWNMTDGNQTASVDMTNRSVRESFEKPFAENLAKLKETIEHNGWGYLSVKTTDNYLEKLMSYVREGSI